MAKGPDGKININNELWKEHRVLIIFDERRFWIYKNLYYE